MKSQSINALAATAFTVLSSLPLPTPAFSQERTSREALNPVSQEVLKSVKDCISSPSNNVVKIFFDQNKNETNAAMSEIMMELNNDVIRVIQGVQFVQMGNEKKPVGDNALFLAVQSENLFVVVDSDTNGTPDMVFGTHDNNSYNVLDPLKDKDSYDIYAGYMELVASACGFSKK